MERISNIIIVGTAHVSADSIDEVRSVILKERPGAVAVELDEKRYKSLVEGKDWRKEPIADLLRSDRLYIALANALMLAFQRMVGQRVGSRPGEEMLAAIEAAKEVDAEVVLVDRDITKTLRRALDEMSLREKYGILKELLSPDDEVLQTEVNELLETYKDSDVISELVDQLRELSPGAHRVLLSERDAYMARRIQAAAKDRSVVAVVGAAHANGITTHLRTQEEILEVEVVERRHWGRMFLYALPFMFVAVFLLALLKGVAIGAELGRWVLINGVLSALCTLLARGSIPAIITAFLAAPITSLSPFLAAGWFAGLVEAWWRRLTVEDLEDLTKIEDMDDLMSNSAFRVLLVGAAANIGSTIGTFVSIPAVLTPLLTKLG